MRERKPMTARDDCAYKNAGQEKERRFSLDFFGIDRKADNVPHTAGGDCGIYQVKSARATVCKGLDLDSYLDADGAKAWAYVTNDMLSAYVMNRAEWTAFVKAFGTVTYESKKNGGGAKIRLKHESREMLEWLEARA